MDGIRKINAINFRHIYFKENLPQTVMVLKYLEVYKTLTQDEAYEAFDCRRLAAVIHNLKKKYDIVTTIDKKTNCAVYSFAEDLSKKEKKR